MTSFFFLIYIYIGFLRTIVNDNLFILVFPPKCKSLNCTKILAALHFPKAARDIKELTLCLPSAEPEALTGFIRVLSRVRV